MEDFSDKDGPMNARELPVTQRRLKNCSQEMAEKYEDGPKSKEKSEKSVVPVIPKTSEDNIVEEDKKKIGEKCAAKSSKKKEEKSPTSVVPCETPSKNERRRKKRIEKGNLGGRKIFKTDGNSRGAPKRPREGKVNRTNRRGNNSAEHLESTYSKVPEAEFLSRLKENFPSPKIPILLEISPEKLVVPPSEHLEVTVRNPTEDTQTLRCTFDSYYFLVDFKDAKSSGQHGVTPAAAYGCYELGPGESCSLTVRTTDREIDQSVDLKPLKEGTYNVKKPFENLPRLKDHSNIIDISFYNHKRPEGFLKFKYRKKEKRTNAKWMVRTQQLHLTDDIQEMIKLEDEKTIEKEKDKDGTQANETATVPNPPEYMKFYRMKWIYNATQGHQKWRASWAEQLRNDDEGTHRVFYIEPDFVVRQFVLNKENYNKTLGTEIDNLAFWGRILEKENIRHQYGCKTALLERNAGFGKHDFTAETLEESLEKAEKFLEDQRKEDLKNYDLHIEQVRMEREKEEKNKKEKEELEKEEELKKEPEMEQPVKQEEEVKKEKKEDKKKEDRKEEELKKEPEIVQPVKQEEEKKVEKKEEKKEEKKKKNPCCSIC